MLIFGAFKLTSNNDVKIYLRKITDNEIQIWCNHMTWSLLPSSSSSSSSSHCRRQYVKARFDRSQFALRLITSISLSLHLSPHPPIKKCSYQGQVGSVHEIKLQDEVEVQRQWILTLILLTWRIWWAPNNASKWQMGFNSEFKRLI